LWARLLGPTRPHAANDHTAAIPTSPMNSRHRIESSRRTEQQMTRTMVVAMNDRRRVPMRVMPAWDGLNGDFGLPKGELDAQGARSGTECAVKAPARQLHCKPNARHHRAVGGTWRLLPYIQYESRFPFAKCTRGLYVVAKTLLICWQGDLNIASLFRLYPKCLAWVQR
jgi:hypothetical protein